MNHKQASCIAKLGLMTSNQFKLIEKKLESERTGWEMSLEYNNYFISIASDVK